MGWQAYKGHAELDVENIRAFAICDRCCELWNHDQLSWQWDFRGPSLQNIRILVCPNCLDDPNATLRTIVLPADPIPVYNARIDQYTNPAADYVTGPVIVTSHVRSPSGYLVTFSGTP